jgi:hypothetical protein
VGGRYGGAEHRSAATSQQQSMVAVAGGRCRFWYTVSAESNQPCWGEANDRGEADGRRCRSFRTAMLQAAHLAVGGSGGAAVAAAATSPSTGSRARRPRAHPRAAWAELRPSRARPARSRGGVKAARALINGSPRRPRHPSHRHPSRRHREPHRRRPTRAKGAPPCHKTQLTKSGRDRARRHRAFELASQWDCGTDELPNLQEEHTYGARAGGA